MSHQQQLLEYDAGQVAARDDEHEFHGSWEWGQNVIDFVLSRTEGRSAKICTGVTPIADVNVDLERYAVCEGCKTRFDVDEHACPDCGSTNRAGEVHVAGDMFDLPFRANEFDTVISDPPWKELSKAERRQLFEECVRVCHPEGQIIYNATWIPDIDITAVENVRARQERQFWGCPSFITISGFDIEDRRDLLDAFDHEIHPFTRRVRPRLTEALDPDEVTDPRALDPMDAYRCCPTCGCSELGPVRDMPGDGPQLHECLQCGFRVSEGELDELARALHDAVEERGLDSPAELRTIQYTPPNVDRMLDRAASRRDCSVNRALEPELPWVPDRANR